MNRARSVFDQGKAFVAYLTVGQGGLDYSLQCAEALLAGGVNILELGVPFSDPIADGPVIQDAMMQALHDHVDLQQVIEVASKINAKHDVPMVLFSYYNPILSAGDDFYAQAKASGIDAMLVVDLPLQEATAHQTSCKEVGIEPVYVITPATPQERIIAAADHGNAFLYYACRKGTTGMKADLPEGFADKMQSIKSAVSLPTVAGFGIANRDMAEQVLQCADGFVVGSYFVKAMLEKITPQELTKLAQTIDPR